MAWFVIQRWMIVGLCLGLAGCTVCENVMRTTHWEPAEFSAKHDRRRSLVVYRSWGEQAWHEECLADPQLAERIDYGAGFVDGFVDYVFAGGNGEPPLVPPRKLWNVYFRSEEGHQRAADWFAGYRHGAQYARDGGYRALSTIRSSLFGFEERGNESPYSRGTPRDLGPEDYQELPGAESLPAPDLAIPPAPSEPVIEAEIEKSDAPVPESIPLTEPVDTLTPQPQQQPPRDMLPENLRELDPPAESEDTLYESNDDSPAEVEAPAGSQPAPMDTEVPQAERAPESIPLIILAGASDSESRTFETVAQEPTSSSVRLVDAGNVAKAEPPLQLATSPPTLLPTPSVTADEPDRGVIVATDARTAFASDEDSATSSIKQASAFEISPGNNALRSPVLLKPGPPQLVPAK